MNAFVIDTNVAIVANGKTPQAGRACELACIRVLVELRRTGIVVLDMGMQILSEYMKRLSMSGQPGLGDAFMKWVWQVQADSSHCELVMISPHEQRGFVEFPDDQALNDFDRDDRKFVAVALTSSKHPSVLNAVDSDWWVYRDSLRRNGVAIRFLCPEQFS